MIINFKNGEKILRQMTLIQYLYLLFLLVIARLMVFFLLSLLLFAGIIFQELMMGASVSSKIMF